jgi:hypothetical protein
MICGRVLTEQDEALMFVSSLQVLSVVKSSSGQPIDWNTNSPVNWRTLVLSDCYVNSGLSMNVQSNFFFHFLGYMRGTKSNDV